MDFQENITQIAFAWFMLSISVGILGIDRKLGFVKAMMLAMLLSPVGGVIAVMLSKKQLREKRMLPSACISQN
ncbi:MAG: hypothetical protein EOP52_11105 [Sphingobacteriales bacterium]|nr:MAG: hypothetical protein EOP52_11105 [Sphingobacteriales bacterium]